MIREHCTSTAVRPCPTVALPDRGPFEFPEPYGTVGIRVTNASDGPILPTGYSYWRGINAHEGRAALYVFLGTDRNRGGQGPSLWRVDKGSGEVTPCGPVLPADHPLMWSTGETWYWSACDPALLYACDLEHLYRINVETQAVETVIDITPYRALGKVLWQFHSSHDDRTHSATWKDATTYSPQGCIVYREGCENPWIGVYPATGALDECQIDKSGEWLVIKENLDGKDGEDNRIIHVADGHERVLMDRDGAAGHSDCGYGYMVAANNWSDLPNVIQLWPFDQAREQGRVVYHSPVWNVELNHIAHGNARPAPAEEQYVIGSGATRATGPRANEIVGFYLDGSLEAYVIAPTLVDLDAPGGGDDYSKMPKGNLDVTGRYFLWTSNHGSDRLDAFIVEVPDLR